MRIVLEDGMSLQKVGGIGQVTRGIYHYLKQHPEIEQVKMIPKNTLVKVSPVGIQRLLYIVWINSWLQYYLVRNKVDIIHFTNYLIPSVRYTKTKYVVSIHDLNAWRFPETMSGVYMQYLKLATLQAIRGSDMVFTPSETVKHEITSSFSVDENKIKSVGYPISQTFFDLSRNKTVETRDFIKQKLGITRDFILFVSTLEKRKNAITLVHAFKKIRQTMDLQLVLVGNKNNGSPEIYEFVRRNELGASVLMPGSIVGDELICIYDMATLFVWPSLYEGFGIPVVEAMIRGIPIVASDIPVTREIAGSVAAYYNNPLDYEALAEMILEVISNNKLKQELITRGLERSKIFSWENVGKRYLQAYSEICKK